VFRIVEVDGKIGYGRHPAIVLNSSNILLWQYLSGGTHSFVILEYGLIR
jgi:hypothetical protein